MLPVTEKFLSNSDSSPSDTCFDEVESDECLIFKFFPISADSHPLNLRQNSKVFRVC